MSILKNIFKTLCLYLIIFFTAEGIIRILLAADVIKSREINYDTIVHQYSDNPELVYELKPSFSGKDSIGREIRTNAHAMRDYDEYSLEKSADVYRIVIVGDSVSFGINLPQNIIFSELLERKLNEQKEVDVLNFSVAGYNSAQEEIILKERVPAFSPDLVIVAYCLNDNSYTDGLGKLARQFGPKALGPRLHSKLITYVTHGLERAIFSKIDHFANVEKLFMTMKNDSQKYGYKPLVIIFPYNYSTFAEYEQKDHHTRVRQMLTEQEIAHIDFLDVWKDLNSQQRTRLYLSADDKVHFSDEGMRKVSETLFEYIQRL